MRSLVFSATVGLFALLFFSQCSTIQRQFTVGRTTIITHGIDASDADLFQRTYSEELDHIAQIIFQEEKTGGGEIMLSYFSDATEGSLLQHTIEPTTLNDNPYQKGEKMDSFTTILADMYKTADSLSNQSASHSYIYSNIRFLADLTVAKKGDRKILLITTDGRENSSAINLYRTGITSDDYDATLKKLEEYFGKLPDMTGVEIYFLQSLKNSNSKKVLSMRGFWLHVFRAANADVKFISALQQIPTR